MRPTAATQHKASWYLLVRLLRVRPATHSFSQRKLREDLLKNGVLQVDGAVLRFSLDYVFSSPSTTASLIHGRSANGRIEWKDSNGKTLKALQEAEAAQ